MLPLLLVAMTFGQASRTADIAAVAKLETTWNEAHRKGDAATLQQLFADDMVVVVPGMRPLSKADSLAVMATGKMTFERVPVVRSRCARLRRYSRGHGSHPAHAGDARRREAGGRLALHEGLLAERWGVAGDLVPRLERRSLTAPRDYQVSTSA